MLPILKLSLEDIILQVIYPCLLDMMTICFEGKQSMYNGFLLLIESLDRRFLILLDRTVQSLLCGLLSMNSLFEYIELRMGILKSNQILRQTKKLI